MISSQDNSRWPTQEQQVNQPKRQRKSRKKTVHNSQNNRQLKKLGDLSPLIDASKCNEFDCVAQYFEHPLTKQKMEPALMALIEHGCSKKKVSTRFRVGQEEKAWESSLNLCPLFSAYVLGTWVLSNVFGLWCLLVQFRLFLTRGTSFSKFKRCVGLAACSCKLFVLVVAALSCLWQGFFLCFWLC